MASNNTALNNTTLYVCLKWLSGLMVTFVLLSYLVPMYKVGWNGYNAYSAAHLLASCAFGVTVFFAVVTAALFVALPWDYVVLHGESDHRKAHLISLGVFAVPLLLISVSVAIRIFRPEFLGLAPEGHALVASTLVALSLLVLDAILLLLCKKDRLKEEWFSFAAEACKLDAGIFLSFLAALVFVAVTIHHVSAGHPHELRLVVFGLEAALLTVSTVAFSFDSGGLFKPWRNAVGKTGGEDPATDALPGDNNGGVSG